MKDVGNLFHGWFIRNSWFVLIHSCYLLWLQPASNPSNSEKFNYIAQSERHAVCIKNNRLKKEIRIHTMGLYIYMYIYMSVLGVNLDQLSGLFWILDCLKIHFIKVIQIVLYSCNIFNLLV